MSYLLMNQVIETQFENPVKTGEMQIVNLPIGSVFANPNQPRTIFDSMALAELAANIKLNGLMQPIIVVPRGNSHMIVAGERRWRATALAGLPTIPAIVRADLSQTGVKELALIENLLRRDLTILEEARAYQDFLSSGYSVESLAEVLGFKQPHRITERTRLLRLDPQFQDALSRGILNPSQAYEMAGLSKEGQFALWRAIQNGQCESYAKLRRLAAAIRDTENQTTLFDQEPQTEKQRASINRVERFIAESGKLVGLITEDDLSVIEGVLFMEAQVCAGRLELIEKICRQVRQALLTNVAKQQAQAA